MHWSANISGVTDGNYYQFEITNQDGDNYDPGGLPFLVTDPYAPHRPRHAHHCS